MTDAREVIEALLSLVEDQPAGYGCHDCGALTRSDLRGRRVLCGRHSDRQAAIDRARDWLVREDLGLNSRERAA